MQWLNTYARIEQLVKMFICSVLCVQCLPLIVCSLLFHLLYIWWIHNCLLTYTLCADVWPRHDLSGQGERAPARVGCEDGGSRRRWGGDGGIPRRGVLHGVAAAMGGRYHLEQRGRPSERDGEPERARGERRLAAQQQQPHRRAVPHPAVWVHTVPHPAVWVHTVPHSAVWVHTVPHSAWASAGRAPAGCPATTAALPSSTSPSSVSTHGTSPSSVSTHGTSPSSVSTHGTSLSLSERGASAGWLPSNNSRNAEQYLTQQCEYTRYLTQQCEYTRYLTQQCEYTQHLTQQCEYTRYLTQQCEYTRYLTQQCEYTQYLTQQCEYTRYLTQPERARGERRLAAQQQQPHCRAVPHPAVWVHTVPHPAVWVHTVPHPAVWVHTVPHSAWASAGRAPAGCPATTAAPPSSTSPSSVSTHGTSPSSVSTHGTSLSSVSTHSTSPSSVSTHGTSPSSVSTHGTSPSSVSTHSTSLSNVSLTLVYTWYWNDLVRGRFDL